MHHAIKDLRNDFQVWLEDFFSNEKISADEDVPVRALVVSRSVVLEYPELHVVDFGFAFEAEVECLKAHTWNHLSIQLCWTGGTFRADEGKAETF